MGYGGRIIRCGCQEETVLDGVGMALPYVYHEAVKDIKAGKYGDEMKYIMRNMNFVAVDTLSEMYYCKNCGHLKTMQVLNLYIPKDVEKLKKKEIGNWTVGEGRWRSTVGELGEIPYWYPGDDDAKDFVMIYKYRHICPICGTKMSRVKLKKIVNEKCPKCGEKYQVEELNILWD